MIKNIIKERESFRKDVMKLFKFIDKKYPNWYVVMEEVLRPLNMQYIYYYGFKFDKEKIKFIKDKKAIRSKTLKSNHLRGLAIDLKFYDEKGDYILKKYPQDKYLEMLEPIGKYWESLNTKNKWGGHYKSWKDAPHFEKRK